MLDADLQGTGPGTDAARDRQDPTPYTVSHVTTADDKIIWVLSRNEPKLLFLS